MVKALVMSKPFLFRLITSDHFLIHLLCSDVVAHRMKLEGEIFLLFRKKTSTINLNTCAQSQPALADRTK